VVDVQALIWKLCVWVSVHLAYGYEIPLVKPPLVNGMYTELSHFLLLMVMLQKKQKIQHLIFHPVFRACVWMSTL
jgi:hypothetical protein